MGQSQLADAIGMFIMSFTGIVYEALPFVVLGALIAGILEEVVPQQLISRILGEGRILPIFLGALLGLAFPMCECGIIPIMRRLLRKGLPLSCCTAYLLAGPIINIIVLLSTYMAFSVGTSAEAPSVAKYGHQMNGVDMLCFRAGMAFVVSVVTSFIVEFQWKKHGTSLLTPLATPSALPIAEEVAKPRTPWQRVSNVSETALHDCVDILVFLILGALLASSVKLGLSMVGGGTMGEEAIKQWTGENMIVTILIMMLFAVVICLCSEADAFVAASFSTMHPVPKLAFLVLGPMLDLKLLFLYTRVFKPRLIMTIVSAVVLQVLLYSIFVGVYWNATNGAAFPWLSP